MDSLETREIVVPDASRPIIRGSRSVPDSKRQPADRNRSARLRRSLAADPDFVERERAEKTTTIFVSLLTPGYEVHWKMFPCERDRFVRGASMETALDLSFSLPSDTAVINLPPTADFTAAAAGARRAAGSSIFSAFFMGGREGRSGETRREFKAPLSLPSFLPLYPCLHTGLTASRRDRRRRRYCILRRRRGHRRSRESFGKCAPSPDARSVCRRCDVERG